MRKKDRSDLYNVMEYGTPEDIAKDDDLYELFDQCETESHGDLFGFENLDPNDNTDKDSVFEKHQMALALEKELPNEGYKDIKELLMSLSKIHKMLTIDGYSTAIKHLYSAQQALDTSQFSKRVHAARVIYVQSKLHGKKNGRDFSEAKKVYMDVARHFYATPENRNKYTRRKFQAGLTAILEEIGSNNLPLSSDNKKVDEWIKETIGKELSDNITRSTAPGMPTPESKLRAILEKLNLF